MSLRAQAYPISIRLAHHTDRMDALREDAAGRSPQGLRTALELVDDTRARLALNVAYDLALEALAFRLERVVRTAVR